MFFKNNLLLNNNSKPKLNLIFSAKLFCKIYFPTEKKCKKELNHLITLPVSIINIYGFHLKLLTFLFKA